MCLTEFKSFLILHLIFHYLADCFFFYGGEQLLSLIMTNTILSLSNFTTSNLMSVTHEKFKRHKIYLTRPLFEY